MKYFILMKFSFVFLVCSVLLLSLPDRLQREQDILCEHPDIRRYVLQYQAIIYSDSVLKLLTLDEKIAQCIMVAVYPAQGEEHFKHIERIIREKKIGGIIFFKGTKEKIKTLSQRFQKVAEIPLWIAIDAEWGIAMRVTDEQRLPYALTLGALRDNAFIRQYGQLVAEQCTEIGVNMNLAPVADVNNNSANPVINYRSFGELPENVAHKAYAYYLGLNDRNVLAVAKHFPGHGNTHQDSHDELPVITDDIQTMQRIHIYPFAKLIHMGIPAIMTAHIYVPSFEEIFELPATLSKKIVTDLLIDSLGFQGLIITDALNMAGVRKNRQPGQIELMAFQAGAHILLMPDDVNLTIETIKQAVLDGRISEKDLDARCRRILEYKYLYLIANHKETEELNGERQSVEKTKALIQDIYDRSITLAYCKSDLIPFRDNTTRNILFISNKEIRKTPLTEQLEKHANLTYMNIPNNPGQWDIERFVKNIQRERHDMAILAIYGMSNKASNRYGISNNLSEFCDIVSKQLPTVLILFGNPYGLDYFENVRQFAAVVVAYEENSYTEISVGKALTGVNKFIGMLPVSSGTFRAGSGINQMQRPLLVDVGNEHLNNIQKRFLDSIDILVERAIQEKAFPGCQILLAYDGKVFYHKAFGYHTYDKTQKVELSHLYDLASLTKILATTAAVMKLFEQGKIGLSDSLGLYLPWVRGTPVSKITIREILAHQSGFDSWIPFYLSTITSDSLRKIYYRNVADNQYIIQVAAGMWLRSDYRDSIFQKILYHPLKSKRYRYSDLGFLLLKEVIETVSGLPFPVFLDDYFYQPLQLYRLTFHPLQWYPLNQIVPTENDTVFRKQLVHGYVHDPATAMLGGCSGSAGLFGNAWCVASMMQVFLNYGKTVEGRLFDSLTVVQFTSRQFPGNRRGLGFDKPAQQASRGNTSHLASPLSFGHTGFTGTFAWADPQHKLVVVFLSNRIYPDAQNRRINSMQIREKVQYYAYRAIGVNGQK